MKRFVLPVVASLVVGFAPAAMAQEPAGRTERTPRTEGTGRTPGTPGTGRTEGTGRTPGTGRTAGTPRTGGEPRELPKTGSPATMIAMDGVTMLGAGLVLLRARRRLQS